MKLFVYEHITSGALAGQELPHSLAKEGDLMLLAILQDLAVQPQIELIILRDSRLSEINSLSASSPYEVFWVQDNKHFDQQWNNALSLADMSFIIAPETDRQLETIQQNVLNSGKNYLGSSQAATQLCADKLQCFAHLTNSNISTVKTQLASEWLATKQGSSDAVIIKPIDGAGCLNTLLFESSLKAQNYLQNTPALVLSSLIVQAYIKGTAASLCLFISDETVTVLSINRQLISQKQSQLVFVASENTLSADEFSRDEAQKLADEIYQAFPSLWGFIGIDFVVTPSGPILIEINPRLTTSYIGLNSVLNFNPTDSLIKHMEEKTLPRPSYS